MSDLEYKVLDKGFVRLDDSMADDLSVANSARVSFAKRSHLIKICGECDGLKNGCDHPYWHDKDYSTLSVADAGLIKFLMDGRHGTPFEHNAFRFHIKAPIFVAREWMRHRIGSFNEWSGRYSKLEAEFYIPAAENVRSQVGKPGSYTFEPVDVDTAFYTQGELADAYLYVWDKYEKLLADGVAKEQARMVLPVGIYTQFYWTVNARSLMNFLSLRTTEFAMMEIREYAKIVEGLFAEKMPRTAEVFIENGRVAP